MSAKRSPLRWIVPLLVVAGGVYAWAPWGASDDEASLAVDGATVQRGPLRITVMERGNLEAAESTTLKSQLEGRSTVLWLIDEGTVVEEGELLCELDTSELQDRRVQQEIKVQNAEATLVKAEQNYAIQVSQNESDIALAQQQLDFAVIDLEKYVEGDMPQEKQKREEDIVIADEELTRADQDLQWSERLAEQGFLEQSQLDADRLSKTRAEITLAQAKRARELFEQYEIPRRMTELEAAVEEKKRELERVKLQAKARLADYEADKLSAEATANLERSDLEKIESQIGAGKLVAPVGGMVVYARERSRWGDGEPMAAGAEVRERQDIITIPSAEGFTAEVSLHESVLEKVQVGMPCLITIDALGQGYAGEVTFKAVLPDQNSWWANPDTRVYRTVVKLTDSDVRMRPGMSCSVEILVDELEDVFYAPVQSVFLDAGSPVVFISERGVPEKRPVTVGQNDGKWVEIQEGVDVGDVVLLSTPPGAELAPASDMPSRSDDGWGGGGAEGRPSGSDGSESGRPSGRPQGAKASAPESPKTSSTAKQTVKADVVTTEASEQDAD